MEIDEKQPIHELFELWLNARVNLAVTGLLDRVNRLEEERSEMRDLSLRMNEMLAEKIPRALCTPEGLEDAMCEAISKYIRENSYDVVETLSHSSLWDDAVGDAIDPSTVKDSVEELLRDATLSVQL